MALPKLNQTALLEVLVTEIESFKKTKGEYSHLLKTSQVHLERLEGLYKQPLVIDSSGVNKEVEQMEQILRRALYLPRWLMISFIVVTFLGAASVFVNFLQYRHIRDAKEYIFFLEDKLAQKTNKKP